MNHIVRDKKKSIIKISSIILIVIVSLLILCTVFGIVDYFRTKNGKKPIFIYHTTYVKAFDVKRDGHDYIESAIYYGIGYTVSICNSATGKYTFQLGDKQKESCYTSLTCTANEKGTLVLNDDSTVSYDKNDKDNYEYTFFEDKLTHVTATLIRPISSIENIETSSAEIKEYYDNIPGCVGSGKKINEEAYETVISCNIPEMSNDDIDDHLPIRNKELLEYTRDEIIAYHHNDLTCK